MKEKYRIIQLLSQGRNEIKQLSDELHVSLATIRDHLYDLEESGLVKKILKRANFEDRASRFLTDKAKYRNLTMEKLARLTTFTI
ncbi:MAG: ArsR family transcriptional regulator, partial [Candidatus Aenigmarchaeota archaeon]|nr:ArsR family transcriptional regulator [Candidatus Aenigmarchaeota archaeon]